MDSSLYQGKLAFLVLWSTLNYVSFRPKPLWRIWLWVKKSVWEPALVISSVRIEVPWRMRTVKYLMNVCRQLHRQHWTNCEHFISWSVSRSNAIHWCYFIITVNTLYIYPLGFGTWRPKCGIEFSFPRVSESSCIALDASHKTTNVSGINAAATYVRRDRANSFQSS